MTPAAPRVGEPARLSLSICDNDGLRWRRPALLAGSGRELRALNEDEGPGEAAGAPCTRTRFHWALVLTQSGAARLVLPMLNAGLAAGGRPAGGAARTGRPPARALVAAAAASLANRHRGGVQRGRPQGPAGDAVARNARAWRLSAADRTPGAGRPGLDAHPPSRHPDAAAARPRRAGTACAESAMVRPGAPTTRQPRGLLAIRQTQDAAQLGQAVCRFSLYGHAPAPSLETCLYRLQQETGALAAADAVRRLAQQQFGPAPADIPAVRQAFLDALARTRTRRAKALDASAA